MFCFKHLLVQATAVLLPKWNLDQALKFVSQYALLSLGVECPNFVPHSLTAVFAIRYKITTLNLIPSLVHQLVNSPKTRHADLTSLRLITNGGANLPSHLLDKFFQLAPKVNMGDGMSPLFPPIPI